MKTLVAATLLSGGLLVLSGQQTDLGRVVHRTTRASSAPVSVSPDRPSAHAPAPSAADLTDVVKQYCVVCHNDAMQTGNLSLQTFDVATATDRAESAEKMITKLRAGMMPPPGAPRPSPDTLLALVETLESTLDKAAAKNPNPGSRSFQRLTRAEYSRSVKTMLGLDVDAGEWLPLDSYLANFENMAAAQTLSPAVLESYLNAANEVSRLAVGQPNAAAASETYRTAVSLSQHAWDHVEGAPEGTRGGIVVDHHFPADGDYDFETAFWGGDVEHLEDLDLSIDGERVSLIHVEILHTDAEGPRWSQRTEPIFVKAGQHKVAAAFIRKTDGLYDDLIQPYGLSLNGTRYGVAYGVTLLTHLRELSIRGPQNPTGVSETPVRQQLFSCRPTSADQARPCAQQIVTRVATQAYRRPLTDRDLEGLMSFYDGGAEEGGFEMGVRSALEAILASPHFVFRMEAESGRAQPGQPYRISDMDLASRLSFFLWDLPPDQELIALASEGKLSRPKVLEEQTLRLLADPRAEALATRFASQWLRMQDLDKVKPDVFWYPQFSQQLANDFRRETQVFFYDLIRRDRSLLELFSADYTFVNERIAKHYGIPGVTGDEFRMVAYPEGMPRKGLLGHGSVLTLTSLGGRTSPVLRGKWVMEVLLGTPPPPPPPGVPDLEQTAGTSGGRILTTRERMEQHRASPVCQSCHRFMDPIGLALDNFDVTGRWRIRENGVALDTRGQLYDGTPVQNPADLTQALLRRPIPLVRNFTLNLMAYALGRRVEYYDGPSIRAITAAAEKEDYRMSSLVLGVVKSPAFQMKMAAATTESAAGGGAEN